MKDFVLLFSLLLGVYSIRAQEYKFINEVITPFEEYSSIPKDTIYIKDKFIVLGKDYLKPEYLNEETIKFLWNNKKNSSPVELFLKNFNLNHLRIDIEQSAKDSIIYIGKLKNYFYLCDENFIKNNPKKKFLSISKPFFNCNRDWCIIVMSEYIPYTDTGGNALMYIYIKINEKWILYDVLNLSLT
jgi:hypothetical protein